MSTQPEDRQETVSVWEDLKRRNVYRVGAGYAALAWLLIQISEIVFPRIGFPGWSVTLVIAISALGLPIALILGWSFEITPKGIIFDKPRNVGWPAYIVIDVLIVITIAVAGTIFWLRVQGPDDSEQFENSVAVLRFLDICEDAAERYLGDGLTEELIHELVNLRKLKVPARTSIWPLSRSELSAADIAERLNVKRILEGSVRCNDDTVRVTAQLIDEQGFHLWSESYDRKVGDILAIQKNIAREVVEELDLMLTAESRERLQTRPTQDSTAYASYLMGRQYLRQPADIDTLQRAEDFFSEAVDADSRFALAHAGLCATQLARYRITRATENFEQAERACHRSLTLDDGLAEVYTALGDLYRHAGLAERAEDEYRAALAINPGLEGANYGLGRSYQALGQLDAAEDALRNNVASEPGYWGSHMGLGNFLFRQGRFAEAVPYYETVIRLEPDYVGGHTNLGSALYWLGDWEEAERAFLRSIELEPRSMTYQNIGTVFYYQKRYAEAAAMHEKAIAIAPSDHRAWGKLAAARRYVPGQELASQEAYGKALELVRSRLSVNPDEPEDLAFMCGYLVNTGEFDAARVAVARAKQLDPESPIPRYFAAILETWSGNNEQAQVELRKAVELGYSTKLLDADPQFQNIGRN